jgi:hypothetical protein
MGHMSESPPREGPPPLAPFDLVLHHDGRWSHEGQPILNRKLREVFDRSVVYLPEERKYVVKLGHFRGQIVVEEAGFFVRDIDLDSGAVHLSDGSTDELDPISLRTSSIDGALLCRVKRALDRDGVPARFFHAAQADLLHAVEDDEAGWVLRVRGRRVRIPDL